MGTWTISVDDGQMNSLREYGTTYKTGGGAGGCFELSGNTLQEAADNILKPLALAFSNDSILEYPEHVQIEDELFGYSNVAERHMKIIIPCTFEGYHGEYKRNVIIYVDTQKMNVSEMRELLNESRAAFSRRYNIPIRTLENWESGKSKCPEYVRELLERAVKEDVK